MDTIGFRVSLFASLVVDSGPGSKLTVWRPSGAQVY